MWAASGSERVARLVESCLAKGTSVELVFAKKAVLITNKDATSTWVAFGTYAFKPRPTPATAVWRTLTLWRPSSFIRTEVPRGPPLAKAWAAFRKLGPTSACDPSYEAAASLRASRLFRGDLRRHPVRTVGGRVGRLDHTREAKVTSETLKGRIA